MKKILLIPIVLTGLLFGLSASAATSLILAPAGLTVKAGETFDLTIAVDPQGVKNSTIRVELSFPADLLEVKSFVFGSNSSWIALNQPGYDKVDNTNGILVKTAGYPGGLSSPATFGVVTFSAKQSGTAIVKTTANSMALNTSSQNVISATPGQASVTVSAVAVKTATPTPAPLIATLRTATPRPVAIVSATPLPTTTEPATVNPSGTPTESPVANGLLAGIGTAASFGTGSKTLGVIVVIVVILLLYWLIRKFLFRRKAGI